VEGEKERGKKLSANEILHQSCHPAGLKKWLHFLISHTSACQARNMVK